MELGNAMNGSIVRKTKTNSISVISITRFSISATLAKSLGRSGYERGGVSRVSSNTKTMGIDSMMKTISISKGIAVSISKISWLSISLSTTLAVMKSGATTETGGGCVGGGNSWPVGVGIIQSWGCKEISGLSIGRWGSGGSCGQAGGNL